MTPLERSPHRPHGRTRTLLPLLVAVGGIAVGAGVIIAPRPGAASTAGVRAAAVAATSRPLSDRAIYARIAPSVVDVTATLRAGDETATGTGFVVSRRDGLVLTNNHVIRNAASVTVSIPATGRTYRARVVGTDPSVDIAVLALSPAPGLPAVPGLRAAPLGDSATVTVGAAVIAIGNRAGAGGSPASAPGVISGTGRSVQASDRASAFTETLHGLLATTARIEPGDSGGPLADAAGTVIGVDTAAGMGHAAGGYAIPIDAALAAERQILGKAGGRG